MVEFADDPWATVTSVAAIVMVPLPELVVPMVTDPTPVEGAWVASPEYWARTECVPVVVNVAL